MRIAAWKWTAVVAFAAMQVMAAPPAETSEPRFRISGTVVNGVTGQTLAKARVTVAPDDSSSQPMEMTTGSDGRFLFEGLPAGSWTLHAERRGFIGQDYGQRSITNSGAIWIITGSDGGSENIRFALNPPAVIKGKVADVDGEPIMHAFVQLLAQLSGLRKEYRVAKTVPTDDTGEYRIPDLPAGKYYLFVIVPAPAGDGGYTPQYYPNAAGANSAKSIALKPGEEFSADFSLLRTHGVSLQAEGFSGIPGGENSELLALLAPGPENSAVSVSTLGPGSGRTFSHLVPGHYKLVVADLKGTTATSKWVDVGPEGGTVTLPFANPPDVTAKVRVENGDASLLPSAMLGFTAFGDPGQNYRPIPRDGAVTFPALASGRYMIQFASKDLYIKSVTARNARVADGMIELPESGPVQLEITVAGDVGRVKGKVRSGDKPVSGDKVVLAPSQESAAIVDYHAYISDSDGTFDFRGVKPGSYLLFATPNVDLEYGDRAALAQYLASAKTVRVAPKGTVELRIEPCGK
jgi:Carboxypeptidase regulatory-like domain